MRTCLTKKIYKMGKRTTVQFIEEARKIHGNKYDYSTSEYVNNHTKIKIRCPEHGIFEQTSVCHINRHQGCPYCAHPSRDTESFIKTATQKHNGFYNYNKVIYKNNSTKVCIICPTHGEFWQTPNDHLDGCGCPKCKPTKLKKAFSHSREMFIKKAREVHGDKYIYDKVEYVNYHTPVTIICQNHGEFTQEPASHISQKAGCPHCKCKSQSVVFEKLINKFPEENILFEVGNTRLPWLDGQRLDIYFPKYNIAIEYNGKQHYEVVSVFGGETGFQDTVKRDSQKREKCIQYNCKLFELKYDYTEQDFYNLCSEIENIINQQISLTQEERV